MMLTERHCDVFNRPFFQFSQLKQYAPDTIPQLKTDYRHAWSDWKTVILEVFESLSQHHPQFAAPHIERWCNGWQVRAHFFAYFKYHIHHTDAVILSVLLNRKRLTVSLDWHVYKAAVSSVSLAEYNRWLDHLNMEKYADFDVWHGSENEYADYRTLAQQPDLTILSPEDFYCIGKHLTREELAQYDCAEWISQTIQSLIPLYEAGVQAA